MSFRAIFISIVIGTGLIIAALILHQKRPQTEIAEPTPEFVRASGKCAECHRRETAAIVVEFEQSRHSADGINCLDCHKPMPNQEGMDHRGFVITKQITAQNCKQCHATEYRQFLRSRHPPNRAPAHSSSPESKALVKPVV